MAKCFKAVYGGIRTYAWTSARSHAHHLIYYATASLVPVGVNEVRMRCENSVVCGEDEFSYRNSLQE
ncbi:hypothetical protein E2C01_022057 [Portunus trituberculatus]|uniref:Uncharacterized protein n=1 Tax=Portunus trituberculatus TaxID=210409 RepID=A0A5B7E6K2_PORTR|nr:hypothetical protein [Portunus trituberculatus]